MEGLVRDERGGAIAVGGDAGAVPPDSPDASLALSCPWSVVRFADIRTLWGIVMALERGESGAGNGRRTTDKGQLSKLSSRSLSYQVPMGRSPPGSHDRLRSGRFPV